jgi:hypothetical protein
MEEMPLSCKPRLITFFVVKSNLERWTLGVISAVKKPINVLFDNNIQSTTKFVCSIRRKRTCKNGCMMVELGPGYSPTVIDLTESFSLERKRKGLRDFHP